MYYLEFLNGSGNWVIDCRSRDFANLNVNILKLLFDGYTIRVIFRDK